MEHDLFVGRSVPRPYLLWCKDNCYKDVKYKFVETTKKSRDDPFNAYLIFEDPHERLKFALYFAEELTKLEKKLKEKENGIIQRFSPNV